MKKSKVRPQEMKPVAPPLQEPEFVTVHRFRVGQRVTIVPSRNGSTQRGTFEVVRQLPVENGLVQYHLRPLTRGAECVVDEGQLI